jgi:hypothetical protein
VIKPAVSRLRVINKPRRIKSKNTLNEKRVGYKMSDGGNLIEAFLITYKIMALPTAKKKPCNK